MFANNSEEIFEKQVQKHIKNEYRWYRSQTLCASDNKASDIKLTSTSLIFQKSPNRELRPKKENITPNGKFISASAS